jgi:asparagine synthase (glutamine-hydrolysing)
MGSVIRHRGPDAGGEYLDDQVGLAHRRLSIIDLSEQGNQPMHSADGQLVIVFNGEIYNFLELRAELARQGVSFRTGTDTEVILALYALEGPACLERLNGMFAFAVWDKTAQTLFLARDRVGKKPLYYYHGGGDRLAFASEIKALLELPGMPRKIEPTAIADYLKYLYVPAPKSIFKQIYKLPPGHCLHLAIGGEPVIREYWDLDFSRPAVGTFTEHADQLMELVRQSTVQRMIADVPLGAFLSGGLDSSAVVALMAGASSTKVKTCSIGFADKAHDETPFAREVAELFGTEHREYFVREDLTGTVALLPRYFDEPFADSSAVPTWHVSRLARQAVTVALAGDGGDEGFGGYEKYVTELHEDRVRRSVPRPVLSLLNRAARGRGGTLARKVRSLTGSALLDPAIGFYRTNSFVSDEDLAGLLTGRIKAACRGYDPSEHTTRHWRRLQGVDHVTRMLYTDLKTYLPGDILVKVDRMSMAHSLEVRAPLLDYRVLEFAATLPSSWKIKGRDKKYILKETFGRCLPERILHRRKHGFTVPLDSWFRGELKEMAARNLFDGSRMAQYFDLGYLRQIWDRHQARKENQGTLLWSLLMFALWEREYLSK